MKKQQLRYICLYVFSEVWLVNNMLTGITQKKGVEFFSCFFSGLNLVIIKVVNKLFSLKMKNYVNSFRSDKLFTLL